MSGENMKWIFTHGVVELAEIEEVEKELGVKFPKDYIDCALKNNGGHPTLDIYDFEQRREAVFNRLLSFHVDRASYILTIYDAIRDRLVDDVYPFADDPFGNHICFDYRKNSESPTIVFWDHELAFENPEKGLFPICETFSELLSKLYSLEE
jgi:cell wall assembly regulator SMI1